LSEGEKKRCVIETLVLGGLRIKKSLQGIYSYYSAAR
jgi:hypothetical protein